MKNRLLYLLLLILFFGCRTSDNPEPGENNKDLKYFGFALTDYLPDRLAEIDDFVNLVDLSLIDYSNITAKIDTMSREDNSVIIHIQGLFIENIIDDNSPTGIRYGLLSDYSSNFELWCDNNRDLPLDKVTAFTIADEPCWNKMDMDDLAAIASLVKAHFPTVPIMLIESSESIDSLQISEDIDWLGFDRYGTPDPYNNRDYSKALRKLKRKMMWEHQKIVIIMETQWIPLYSDLGYSQQGILPSMCQSYYDLAKSEEDVIALIAYLLPSDFDEAGQKGFFDLDSDVKEVIEEIGLEIVN